MLTFSPSLTVPGSHWVDLVILFHVGAPYQPAYSWDRIPRWGGIVANPVTPERYAGLLVRMLSATAPRAVCRNLTTRMRQKCTFF